MPSPSLVCPLLVADVGSLSTGCGGDKNGGGGEGGGGEGASNATTWLEIAEKLSTATPSFDESVATVSWLSALVPMLAAATVGIEMVAKMMMLLALTLKLTSSAVTQPHGMSDASLVRNRLRA